MSQSLSQIYTHIIFHVDFSKFAKIPNQLQPKLHAYLSKICLKHQSNPIIVGGVDDHVHILCRMSKNISIAALLKELKIESSKWVKKQFEYFGLQLSKFCWQGGYGAFSVSASQVDSVKKYISNQKEHHKNNGYKDEYRSLLNRYNIEYDEKYLWD